MKEDILTGGRVQMPFFFFNAMCDFFFSEQLHQDLGNISEERLSQSLQPPRGPAW